MKLHIFNPGHDDALAAGTPYYTHARVARKIEDSLWQLPRLWAEENDVVIKLHALKDFHEWDKVKAIEPWGWDAALVHQLEKAGAPSHLLPDATTLHAIRTFSNRQTAVKLLQLIDKPPFVESYFATTWEEVCDYVAHHRHVIAKAPWSCSGRGLVSLSPTSDVRQQKRIVAILNKQGGIALEPFYERTADFAMEFEAVKDGNVRFIGLSRFYTDRKGQYTGNLVASDINILKGLAPFPFPHVKEQICEATRQLLGGLYSGPFGIDMLQFRKEDKIYTHPCVEINLRHTMGCVAIALRKKLPTPESCALFRPLAQARATDCLLENFPYPIVNLV
ncbi:MAG: hypothetical protein IKO20_03405 [Bacteroidaceae bacterium]|nr:hypothetical protein [Bacteroidaceae bacterium]